MASFKEVYPRLRAAQVEVAGISADSMASHRRFASSLGGLPFPLLSDTDRQAITAYGVLNEKGSGARRAVFVVASNGTIVYANTRYDLSKPEHFEAVLDAVGVGMAA